MAVFDKLALASLPYIPRPIMRRLAARYIAGDHLDDALQKLEELARAGHPGILDILGENVTTEAEARGVVGQYETAARAVAKRGLDAYVSVKPTHLGLALGEPLCLELYRTLARVCGELRLFLRVEMEDHPTTDATLRVFEALRDEFETVGIVLQSRLLRTPDDVRRIAVRPIDVRMVKGIYLEPPEIAHTDPVKIREAYVECTRMLFERGARVSLATHDDVLGERCIALAREFRRGPRDYEFAVLLGVREELWSRWRAAGHQVRVYVPFGPEWRPYSQRRLRKNPQIMRHVLRDLLRPRRH